LQMSPFVSAGFWFLIPYYAQDRTLERFRRRIQELRREEKGNS
jgi:hypothetical protein